MNLSSFDWSESIDMLVESLAPEAEVTFAMVEALRRYATAHRRLEAAKKNTRGLRATLYHEAESRMRAAAEALQKEIER